jgi:hypothetical protein
MSEPTARDMKNAAARQAIADRMQAKWDQVYLWSLGAFGAGWTPLCRHFLLDKQLEDE